MMIQPVQWPASTSSYGVKYYRVDISKAPKAKKVTSKQKMKLPSGMVSSFGIAEGKDNPGADLGPGPKASEDGVKDNYLVKAFKYQLVPKNKKGTS